VPGLLLGIPEHPEEADQEHDGRRDRDDPAERRPRIADRLDGAVAQVDDLDPEGRVAGRLPGAAVEEREVGDRDDDPERRAGGGAERDPEDRLDDRDDDAVDDRGREPPSEAGARLRDGHGRVIERRLHAGQA
jgi:hypothetical protein